MAAKSTSLTASDLLNAANWQDDPAGTLPYMAPSSPTPSVSELLNAANWEYDQVGKPSDLQPFLVNGKQLTTFNEADGISASVWRTPAGQLVVAYEGTQFVSAVAAATNPAFSFGQVLEDAGVASDTVTPGERDAAAFAKLVMADAGQQGISASNIFLTGHSLGGIQAEYAAQQTGLGGMAFESTGIPRSSTAVGDGSNFVNVVTDGDSVANYASDIQAEQPFAPAYAPGGSGSLPHYGYVAMIGNPADQASLTTEAKVSALGPVGAGVTAVAYAGNLAAFHFPDVQAHDLGVTLTQQPIGDHVGVLTAQSIDAGSDTIAQFITANNAMLSAAMPPTSGVSPTSGPASGQAAAALSVFGPLAASAFPSLGDALSAYGLQPAAAQALLTDIASHIQLSASLTLSVHESAMNMPVLLTQTS